MDRLFQHGVQHPRRLQSRSSEYCTSSLSSFPVVLSTENMVHLFYRTYVESVLQKDPPSREDILACESIRQRYHIPFSEHISILSDVEEGMTLYVKYLTEYEVISVLHVLSLSHRNASCRRCTSTT